MKIAFVLTQSLDSPSGLGRYGPLAREMVKLGHQVELLALHYDWANLPQKSFIDQGVQVQYVGQMHVQKSGSRKSYFGPGKLLQVSLNATIKLAQAVAYSQAEIIHLGKPQPFNVLAARYGRRGRPLYCDCDDYEAETNNFGNKWQQQIVRYFEDSIVHHAAGLTVNTRFTEQRYMTIGFPAGCIQYVPNGVERNRFTNTGNSAAIRQQWGIPANAPLILYVGTLGLKSHSIDLLLYAFGQIIAHLPETRLMLVGGGEDYDLLRGQVANLGLSEYTIFTGRVLPDKVPSYLAAATVSVDPVHDDLVARARSPLKVLESLVVGTPVVTGWVGDREVMLENGRFGVLVEPGNIRALANGLLQILQNPKQRQTMSQAALAVREQWYWERLVPDFMQIYQNC